MMTMSNRINGGSVRVGTVVTSQTEPVTWQNRLHGMGVMAIQTIHAAPMHPAAQKGSVFVILVPNLAIGIIDARLIHDGEVKIIQELIPGFKVACQLRAPGVAKAAVVEYLSAGEMRQSRVL